MWLVLCIEGMHVSKEAFCLKFFVQYLFFKNFVNDALECRRRRHTLSTMGQRDKRRASIGSSSPSEEGVEVDDNYLEPFVHQVCRSSLISPVCEY